MSRMLKALRQLQAKQADASPSERVPPSAGAPLADVRVPLAQPVLEPETADPATADETTLEPEPESADISELDSGTDDASATPALGQSDSGRDDASATLDEDVPLAEERVPLAQPVLEPETADPATADETSPAPEAELANASELDSGTDEASATLDEGAPVANERVPLAPPVPHPETATSETLQVEARFTEIAERRSQTPTSFEREIAADLANGRRAGEYDQLALAIWKRVPEDAPLSLMLVAAEHEPHTSAVAARLAVAVSHRRRESALLIDAYLAEKVLTAGFELHRAPGLAEVLRRKCDLAGTLVRPATDRLALLPAGTGIVPPTGASRLPGLLRELKQTFRHIIIDAGAVHGSLLESLAKACDATLLVARLGQSSVAGTAEAAKSLQHAGARLLGALVTNAGS